MEKRTATGEGWALRLLACGFVQTAWQEAAAV